MIIADRLKTHNRAEYLLYMWQVEDILRAHGLDFDRLRRDWLSRFDLDDEQRRKTEEWYRNLCDMMREESLSERGHLQINRNTLQTLGELHAKLLGSPRFPYYREMYYRVLPYIVELRKKSGTEEEPELQTCFDALYGVMMLRLQKREVSPATEKAVKEISTLLGQLSDYYFKDQKEPIDFD